MSSLRWARAAAICGFLATAAFAQRPAVEIKVAGNARIPAAAVIAVSGLGMGQPISRAPLDAAVQKLFETGFFTSVNYRYDPRTVDGVNGYVVTLQVAEEPARAQIVLDIPGEDPEQLWQQLKAA